MSTLDSFLKRRAEDEPKDSKKQCRENCPHAFKCYRRNPHHFKEYEHPHLNELLEKGNDPEIPPTYLQDKSIVIEQLKILRELRHMNVPVSKEADLCNNTKVNNTPVASTSNAVKKMVDNNSSFNTNRQGKKTVAERLLENGPYNLFFTTIPDSAATLKHSNAITFTDLLCPSLGELKCSLQLNFMIDIMWLMEQYEKAGQAKKPLTILYGDEFPDMKKYIKLKLPNVTEHHVKMKDPFGIHHSKIGVYVYADNSLRVVVSTANLYYEDWNYYNQGLWISPRCPVLPQDSPHTAGESLTNFKSSFLSYLKEYNVSVLNEWISYIKRADFSGVKVFFVSSAPGRHTAVIRPSQCHLHRIGELLSTHCVLPKKTTPSSEGPLSWGIIAQSSSIGNLGKNPGDWLRGSLLRSLASHKDCPLPSNSNSTLNVVYPTKNNVLNSYYGPNGGGCLPYSKSSHEKQKWLNNYLHSWKADHTNRSRAMPHIKTYCRVSPCTTKLAWLLLTSANISKAAWGTNINKSGSSYVRSYEAGVLFVPKYFDETYFQIKKTEGDEGTKLFPFMYDLPLCSYKSDDEPWCN